MADGVGVGEPDFVRVGDDVSDAVPVGVPVASGVRVWVGEGVGVVVCVASPEADASAAPDE